MAAAVESEEVLCSCGTALPLPYVAHLIQHPFAPHPCVNQDCRMRHRFVPPQTIRSELTGANGDADRICSEAPMRAAGTETRTES